MDVAWEAELGAGAGEAEETPELGEGRYGFEVRVRDVWCDWYAAGCVEVELPTDRDSVRVTLAPVPTEHACAASCEEGRCVSTPPRECAAGTLDCNGLAADGCEEAIDSLDSCGRCGVACGIAESFCARLENGTHECDVLCLEGTACGSACTDTRSDPLHCGTCDRVCDNRPGARTFCLDGTCAYECAPGRADCNADPIDGCECAS